MHHPARRWSRQRRLCGRYLPAIRVRERRAVGAGSLVPLNAGRPVLSGVGAADVNGVYPPRPVLLMSPGPQARCASGLRSVSGRSGVPCCSGSSSPRDGTGRAEFRSAATAVRCVHHRQSADVHEVAVPTAALSANAADSPGSSSSLTTASLHKRRLHATPRGALACGSPSSYVPTSWLSGTSPRNDADRRRSQRGARGRDRPDTAAVTDAMPTTNVPHRRGLALAPPSTSDAPGLRAFCSARA